MSFANSKQINSELEFLIQFTIALNHDLLFNNVESRYNHWLNLTLVRIRLILVKVEYRILFMDEQKKWT